MVALGLKHGAGSSSYTLTWCGMGVYGSVQVTVLCSRAPPLLTRTDRHDGTKRSRSMEETLSTYAGKPQLAALSKASTEYCSSSPCVDPFAASLPRCLHSLLLRGEVSHGLASACRITIKGTANPVSQCTPDLDDGKASWVWGRGSSSYLLRRVGLMQSELLRAPLCSSVRIRMRSMKVRVCTPREDCM